VTAGLPAVEKDGGNQRRLIAVDVAAASMPLETGSQLNPGMVEGGTSPAVPAAAMSGAIGFDPLEFLITLLINISRMDADGFFEEPVREEDAPGYHDVVHRPMCFQRMKEKVSALELQL
jgi:hypothetical protein